jgi:hypothetical protein
VRLNDSHISDHRSYPACNPLDRGQGSRWVAFREADSRARIIDLTGASQIRIERCQRGPGFAELPKPGLGG